MEQVNLYKKSITALAKLLQQDINKRGILKILPEKNIDHYLNSINHLAYKSNKVLIFTGFQCNRSLPFAAENDGIAGSLVIGRQLLRLNKQIQFLIDPQYEKEFNQLVDFYIKEKVPVQSFSPEKLTENEIENLKKLYQEYDTFLSIERPSTTEDNKYYTMNAIDISDLTSPIDPYFFNTVKQQTFTNDNKYRICIGDGGNEIGMGNVYEKIAENVKNGQKISAQTVCDDLLVADISNWGGLGLVQGLVIEQFFTASEQIKQENQKSLYEQIVKINGINLQEEIDLYMKVAELGFRDGIVQKLDGTVDGQPLSETEKFINELNNIVLNVLDQKQK